MKNKKQRTYWQPEIDDKGDIKGHYGEYCFSFEVWHKKKNLMKMYPNCTPVKYKNGDIEEPAFID